MAPACVQVQAGDHGGGTHGDCPAGAECGAAGFLRIAVAHGGVANGWGLPDIANHTLVVNAGEVGLQELKKSLKVFNLIIHFEAFGLHPMASPLPIDYG
jgi:hypothetical protein